MKAPLLETAPAKRSHDPSVPRRIVYFDQNVVSNIAKVRLGRPMPRHLADATQELDAAIQASVRDRQDAICIESMFHRTESSGLVVMAHEDRKRDAYMLTADDEHRRIANDSLFCEAHGAMDKFIEPLQAMADDGATADAVTQLIAKDGTARLRELVQGCFDRRAEQERRVKVVGADGIERAEVRTASRRIETPVGEIEAKRLLYQAAGVEGLAPLDAALGLPDEKYTHDAHLRGPQRLVPRPVI